jgi:hypothetical protein
MSRHATLTATDGGVHSAIAYIYPNSATRLAATGFVAADLGKFAWQTDTNTMWMLSSTSPVVWDQLALTPPTQKVPFDATTTTLVLGNVYTGNVLKYVQFSIMTAFDAGTTVACGTSGNPNQFLAIPGTTVGAYRLNEMIPIVQDDLLLLTVSAVGTAGSGWLFYEVM